MEAGIPVINLDRAFTDKLAYRTWIKGDNYGMGVAAGNYIGKKLKDKGVANPVIVEIPGIDDAAADPGPQQGLRGRAETCRLQGDRRAGRAVHRGVRHRRPANLLQAHPKIDAIWNHDDDQGIGVLAAIKQAGRKEFFMVGGAGSPNAMERHQGRQHACWRRRSPTARRWPRRRSRWPG